MATFSLSSITVVNTTTIKVSFTEPPLALNANNSNDAQNPSNYTLVGPGFYVINSILPIPTDLTSFNIVFKQPLINGQWFLFVSNIVSVDLIPLSPPTNLSFIVQSANIIAPPSNGSNDSSYDILRKHLNPAFQGPGWTSLLKAIGSGVNYLVSANEYAFQQSFLATATGTNLAALAASEGVIQSTNLGIKDNLFRELVIQVSNEKLTENAYLEVLKIFYGIDAVQASATSSTSEPYDLTAGTTLTFTINNRYNAVITFNSNSFKNIAQATAQEVASTITQQLVDQSIPGFADVFFNADAGLNQVRVYSNGLGLISSVTVTGGLAQSIFLFPSKITNLQVTDNIEVISSAFGGGAAPPTGIVRYWLQPNNSLMPVTDLTQVEIGDYLIAQGNIFPSDIQGYFPIVNVTYNSATSVYVDVSSPIAVDLTTTAITAANQLQIFRPVKNTIITDNNRNVIVSRVGNKEVDVVIPATSQVVNRDLSNAAYFQNPTSIPASTLEIFGNTIYIDTPNPHGLSEGNQIYLDSFQPRYPVNPINLPLTPNVPTYTAGNHSNLTDQFPLTYLSFNTTRTCVGGFWGTNTLLQNNTVLVAGGGASTTAVGTSATNTAQVWDPSSIVSGTRTGKALNYAWGATSTMNVARSGHTATLLNNGQVLVAGGWNGATYESSAEIYDPTGNSWTSVSSMNHIRVFHSATLLTDGRVLVIGGSDASSILSTCEVYDPVANTWTDTTSLNFARCNHRATLLNNNKILIDGGRLYQSEFTSGTVGTPGDYVRASELFDPIGLSMIIVGYANKGSYGFPTCLMPNGQVFAMHGGVGGTNANPTFDNNNYIEIWDPTLNRWVFNQGPLNFSTWNGFPTDLVDYQNSLAYYQASKNSIFIGFTGLAGWFGFDLNTYNLRYFDISLFESPGIFNPVHLQVSGVDLVFSGTTVQGNGGSQNAASIILVDGLDYWYSGQFNETVQTVASVVSSTTFTINTPNSVNSNAYSAAFNGSIMPFTAKAGQWAGPFIVDPSNGPVIVNVNGVLNQNLVRGTGVKTLALVDGSAFPDEDGLLCIGLGYSYQSFPIPYHGKQDVNTLLIDFDYIFPFNVPAGADVSLLAYNGGFQDIPPEYGAFWITDSPAGRSSAIQTILNIAAAGGITNIIITYPNDFGLGAWGFPSFNSPKLSDIVTVFSDDNVDQTVALAEIGELP